MADCCCGMTDEPNMTQRCLPRALDLDHCRPGGQEWCHLGDGCPLYPNGLSVLRDGNR